MSEHQFIASNNKAEIFYLFAILNSAVTAKILSALFSVGNEKVGMFVAVKRIKQYIRVPVLTEANNTVKLEIIKSVEEMIRLETITLDDVVDFSAIRIRKFDGINISKNQLILKQRDDKHYTCRIANGKLPLVEQAIKQIRNAIGLDNDITLNALKRFPAIDRERQTLLKAHIDHLVFSLYFNIPLKTVSLASKESIRKICLSSRFYGMIFTN